MTQPIYIDGVYQLTGEEAIEVTRDPAPCGVIVTTTYYDRQTGKLMRQDKNIEVSLEVMEELRSIINQQPR